MSDQSKLGIGQIITSEQFKDAIHVAVAPVESDFVLYPGDQVNIVNGKAFGLPSGVKGDGVVDPFLMERVKPGERFWIFLYPGSITSLRHDWSHPAFLDPTVPVVSNAEAIVKSDAEAWLRQYNNTHSPYGKDFEQFISEIERREIYYYGSDLHGIYELEDQEELEKYASLYLGRPIHINSDWSFSCSC